MADMGRPPIYDNNYHPNVLYAMFWDNSSLSVEDVIKKFNITAETLDDWRKVHPDFSDAWDKCRSGLKGLLLKAGVKEALGYHTYDETLDKHGEARELKKWARPQANILKLLLSNFGIRDKTEVINKTELNDDLMNKAVKNLTDEELQQLHNLINKIEV